MLGAWHRVTSGQLELNSDFPWYFWVISPWPSLTSWHKSDEYHTKMRAKQGRILHPQTLSFTKICLEIGNTTWFRLPHRNDAKSTVFETPPPCTFPSISLLQEPLSKICMYFFYPKMKKAKSRETCKGVLKTVLLAPVLWGNLKLSQTKVPDFPDSLPPFPRKNWKSRLSLIL